MIRIDLLKPKIAIRFRGITLRFRGPNAERKLDYMPTEGPGHQPGKLGFNFYTLKSDGEYKYHFTRWLPRKEEEPDE